MPRKAPALWLAVPLIVLMAACNPASPPSDPAPDPAIPPTTPASAAVQTTQAIQSANPSLSPEGQSLQKPVTCREERGQIQAEALVKRCIAVSPATRPPCNVVNPCALIEAEIKRGCDFFAPNEKPIECAA